MSTESDQSGTGPASADQPEPGGSTPAGPAGSDRDTGSDPVEDPDAGQDLDTEQDPVAERESDPGQDDEPDTDRHDATGPAPDQLSPARRPWSVWRGRRLSGAGAIIGVLVGLLGFALVVQLRSNSGESALTSASQQDLVRILSDLDARKDRLTQEISSLQTTQRQLREGSQGRSAALAEAAKRADELGILAGTLAAQGSGMEVHFFAGAQPLKAWIILDAVEELRGAGAEAMQIAGSTGAPVRVVATTYFAPSGTGILVDGHLLAGPYTITVIGDPQTMQPALNIAGGVADTVHNAGGNVTVDQVGTVRVTATRSAGSPKYAHPAS